MKVFHDTSQAEGKIKNAVVTTGSFDGVHVGHKIIIQRLGELANEIGGESTLVTFYPHPRKVLYPEQKDLKLINSQKEKIALLAKTGLKNLVIIPFSLEFSKTSSHDFITDILIGQLNAKIIVVGQNHHFGHNRSGDFSYLYQLGHELNFKVENIPLQDIENETVSSTKIRKALFEGNIMRANAYLDHQYIISGEMSHVSPPDPEIKMRFHRIEITEQEKLIPPPGIYATNTICSNEPMKSLTLVHDDIDGVRNVDSVLLHDNVHFSATPATLYFYKKIRGGEIFMDQKLAQGELADAMEDVEELIY